jgi:ATP-binding cassette subfamily A (ABC1) protein 3
VTGKMAVFKQTGTLTKKNLLIAGWRHFPYTFFRALLLPLAYIIFLTFSKNLFINNNYFGVGTPQPVLGLAEGIALTDAQRPNIVFVNGGFSGGDIDGVINNVASLVPSTHNVVRLSNPNDILTTCRSTLRGITQCYGAVVFSSSPTEGPSGLWNYTLRADGAIGGTLNVFSNTNDAETYLLPLQRAVDYAIANRNTTVDHSALPSKVLEYSYTSLTQAQYDAKIRQAYQNTIINIVAVAFLVGMVGIVYHEAGFIATERELGMSQLLEAMMPNLRRWQPQVARTISYHLSFDLLYILGWVIMGAVLGGGLWATTNRGIVIVHHILAGLALSSWSIFGGVFFRRAQLSGITTSVITLVLGILAQALVNSKGVAAIAVLGLLFPPCTYVFFIIVLARYEQQSLPTNLIHSAPNNWKLPGIVFWIFLIIQIFVYPLLAIWVERRTHGTASKGRMVKRDELSATEENTHNTVELRGFTKIYRARVFSRLWAFIRRKPSLDVVAVDDLSLTASRGQILVLLGANGSGKSTTLDAIAGMNTVTSGTITVDGRGGLGICPQKNVLWPDLKVDEHIRIFNDLKTSGKRDSKEALQALIQSVDLDRKMDAKAKTLSGGQKRKLQLGMMLTGGSSVCAVDEVSSGLDPLSRRKIWDILLAERGRRTIILTTHFLDEADLLADHIVILSKGTLRAEGSSAELKDKIGGGYRIHLYTGTGRQAPKLAGINADVTFDQTTYLARTTSEAAQVVRALEREGIDDYTLSGPTIEDVFLQLAEEIQAESDSDLGLGRDHVTASPDTAPSEKAAVIGTVTVGSESDKLELLPGRTIGFGRQAWVLFRKRFTLLRRNYVPYFAAFLIPILAAGLVTNLIKHQGQAGCSPAQQNSDRKLQNITNQYSYDLLVGPPAKLLNAAASLAAIVNSSAASNGGVSVSGPQNAVHLVNTATEFTSYISNNYMNVTPAGFFVGDAVSPPMFAYQADASIYAAVFAQNLLDNLLTNVTILTNFKRFEIPWSADTGNSLQLVVYFGLVMATAPAFFSLYPTLERIRHVRGLQYSNGVRSLPLWLAYLLFDFSIILFSTTLVVIVFAAVAGSAWYNLGYLYLVLILYNISAILMSYIISLFAKTQLSAFAFAAGGQAVLFLAYLVGYLCTITYAPVTKVDDTLLLVHFTVSVVTPMGSLIRALFVALNLFSTTCVGNDLAPYPGGIKFYGGPILYLILQSLAMFAVLLLHDKGNLLARWRSSRQPPPSAGDPAADEDIQHELRRVSSSQDCLRFIHVTKTFGKNTAVEDLTFGIKRGEVFALLGPNGAGKSTTISLIRGDIQPSRNGGQIFVDDALVSKERAKARSHLGVCPQFDGMSPLSPCNCVIHILTPTAMDTLTVEEHLQFYARVRGVSDCNHNVRAVMHAVGLQNFAHRMAAKLSGGNKRKLSLAIALMGNPSVLLLDEPSSGMDAAAKRIMWKTLASVVVGRSILLTTHSMEEAGALANRAGIMAKRMLAMGTTEYLRRKHGAAYHCHLVAATAPHTTDEEMERLRSWVRGRFPGASLESKTYHGQLRFSVPAGEVSRAGLGEKTMVQADEDPIEGGRDAMRIDSGVGLLLTLLEDHKEELGLAHYAVSPTTLDQVFLEIVTKHNVEEENYAAKSKGWLKWKK